MLSPHPTPRDDQLTFTFDDRHWRVRGLEKQLSCERLKVNLLVSRREQVHVDTLDLYAVRLRPTFLRQNLFASCPRHRLQSVPVR